MTQTYIQDFAEITAQLVGEMDIIAHDAKPNPWFCKDIFRWKLCRVRNQPVEKPQLEKLYWIILQVP